MCQFFACTTAGQGIRKMFPESEKCGDYFDINIVWVDQKFKTCDLISKKLCQCDGRLKMGVSLACWYHQAY